MPPAKRVYEPEPPAGQEMRSKRSAEPRRARPYSAGRVDWWWRRPVGRSITGPAPGVASNPTCPIGERGGAAEVQKCGIQSELSHRVTAPPALMSPVRPGARTGRQLSPVSYPTLRGRSAHAAHAVQPNDLSGVNLGQRLRLSPTLEDPALHHRTAVTSENNTMPTPKRRSGWSWAGPSQTVSTRRPCRQCVGGRTGRPRLRPGRCGQGPCHHRFA